MKAVEPDSPAAVSRYLALRRRWSRAGLLARVAVVSLAAGLLGGLGIGTYAAATAIPVNTVIFNGPVASTSDVPSPTETPTDTPTTTPTDTPTPTPVEVATPFPAGPAIPTALPASGPTPIPLPTGGETLWSGGGTGSETSPIFAMPTGQATIEWSYNCTGPSPAFQVKGSDASTGQVTGQIQPDPAQQDSGLSSFSAHGSGYVEIAVISQCTWSVTVRD